MLDTCLTGWIGAPWPRQRWVAWPSRRIVPCAFESHKFYIRASVFCHGGFSRSTLANVADSSFHPGPIQKNLEHQALLIGRLWEVSLESIGMCNKRQEKPPAPATRTCRRSNATQARANFGRPVGSCPVLKPCWSHGPGRSFKEHPTEELGTR